MLASLPMYDWPEIRPATNAWWKGISRHAGVEASLSRLTDYTAAWASPDLGFSQTCGYPFTHEFKGKLGYVATPHYAAAGCEGPLYCSIILARSHVPVQDFRGMRAAVNGIDSMSGMLALKAVVAPHASSGRFFSGTVISGSHRQSMERVQSGEADVCAIDSVCFELARRYAPDLLEGLVEVARSPHVPGLPYVTNVRDAAMWQHALAAAFEDPELELPRQTLLLKDFSILPLSAYDAITALETDIVKRGGTALLGET